MEICRKIGPFSKQKFQIYLIVGKFNKKSTEYQTDIFLSTIGDRALKIFNTFTFLKSENKNDIDIILTKFDNHFSRENKKLLTKDMYFV